ncbi:dihydrodipicolinate synthase family protein [Candidatus Aerophobetes bacterium]|uniref:Dihydrodipicolinate synthase family protein n=1 Tax=Aerophobetes bacterium TaxID=2030807 RepID=A0A662D3B4_UNCAE|nr:MAG: dihydrodipicolinate synthase family protein [Candidatus Aerophobetes bacterium]
MMTILKGVVVPIVTPLKRGNQDKIDEDGVEKLCNFLISKGIQGLFPCGTTGEGFLLLKETRKELASLVVKKTRGRVPVVIQTGCINTKSTIELTKHARDVGADGAAIVSPFFYRYSLDDLKDHFVTVAKSVPDFPIYLYNIPDNTNNDITPELLKSIIDEANNVVGIKYSHFDLRRIPEYLGYLGENRAFLTGVDELVYPSYMLGACGCVAGNANVFPEPFVRLYDAFLKGDYIEAKRQQDLIIKIAHTLKRGAHLCYYKMALQFRGVEVGDVVSPQKRLNKEEITDLYRKLKSLGLPLENPIC